jgi:hypothetical protein
MRLRTTRRFAFGSALAVAAAGLAMLGSASPAGASVAGTGAGTVSGTHTVSGAHTIGGALMIRRGGGGMTIVNVGSRLCLDVPDGSKKANLQVQLWTCNGSVQQEWTLIDPQPGSEWEIQNAASLLCLAPYQDGSADPVVQWGCDEADNYELWQIGDGSDYQITNNVLSNFYLCPQGCKGSNGDHIVFGGDCGDDLSMWS